MTFKLHIASIALAAACLTSQIATAQAPSAERILEGARMAATLAKLDQGLSGTLRKGGKSTPITLFLKGEDIQFQFTEEKQPLRIFHTRIADEKFTLFEIKDGKTLEFPANKIVEPIAGTDLTYEDLALRFFY